MKDTTNDDRWLDLRALVLTASDAGRGRLDSQDWQGEDDRRFLTQLKAILNRHESQLAIAVEALQRIDSGRFAMDDTTDNSIVRIVRTALDQIKDEK